MPSLRARDGPLRPALAARDPARPGRSASLVGAWQGFWVAYIGIPAFIVTLAGMLLFRGLDLMILDAPVDPGARGLPEDRQRLPARDGAEHRVPQPDAGAHPARHRVPDLLRAEEPRRAQEVRDERAADRGGRHQAGASSGGLLLATGMLLASYKGLPVVGLILFALVIVYTFITQRTVIGRHIYSVGGNRNAAGLSGVNTKKVDFLVMVNMGLLAGVAGMVFTAYLNAANPKDGVGFELDAIAAVFIGGAAVAGGVGTVTGAMIGGLVMGVLNLGLANRASTATGCRSSRAWCCSAPSRSTCGTRSGPRAAVVLVPRPMSRRLHHPTSSPTR